MLDIDKDHSVLKVNQIRKVVIIEPASKAFDGISHRPTKLL